MQKKLTILCTILFLLPAALLAAGFFSPRVKGEVSVCGVSISGYTHKQAKRAIGGIIKEYENRTIVLNGSGGETVLSTHGTSGFCPQENKHNQSGAGNKSGAKNKNGAGKNGASAQKDTPVLRCEVRFRETFSRALAVKKGERIDLPLAVRYRLHDFPAITKRLQDAQYIPPQNASMQFDPQTPPYFFYTKEQMGRAVDEYALLLLATDACKTLAGLPIGGTGSLQISLPYRTLAPTVTLAKLQAQTQPLASFCTDFSFSSTERKHNVRLAAQKLNGAIIGVGESLSFNQTVGARTKKQGFLPAKVIAGGKYEMGIGGGVCQVSSTLYNAALLSGLQIAEWHAHSLAVGYVEPARDAMVSYGTADLVLRNATAAPVYLVAESKNGRLRFTFYGKPSGITYALVSETIERISPPPPLVERDEKGAFPTLAAGEELVLQKEADGIRALCYLEKTQNGVTTRTLLRKSTYLPVQKRIMIGTGNPSSP